MRFLKTKMALARNSSYAKAIAQQTPTIQCKVIQKEVVCSRNSYQGITSEFNVSSPGSPRSPRSPSEDLSHKNVAKNFGRAICNFILSDLADPYIVSIEECSVSEIKAFKKYIQDKKDGLSGVVELRALLLIQNKDSEKIAKFKRIFQKVAEIFIKYFSVNWIFSGKLTYKMEYVKYRNKLLRKIRNPELLKCLK